MGALFESSADIPEIFSQRDKDLVCQDSQPALPQKHLDEILDPEKKNFVVISDNF